MTVYCSKGGREVPSIFCVKGRTTGYSIVNTEKHIQAKCDLQWHFHLTVNECSFLVKDIS